MAEDAEPIPDLSPERAEELIQSGIIKGGMLPKVETCLETVKRGVIKAQIIDGREPGIIKRAVQGDKVGTAFSAID